MEPLFTILMPTHNRADVVGAAITSVLRQSVQDFELLVVGDGCTDATAAVVASFRDRRIAWFDLPKAPDFGYANRNVALQSARGRIISFCAHDDILFQDHLELIAGALAGGRADLVYSRPFWVSADGVMAPLAGDIRDPEIFAEFEKRNFIAASCVAYTRACHDRFGTWPEDVKSGGDWRIWRRIIADVGLGRVAFLPQPTVIHFKAIWKTRRDSGQPEFAQMLRIADAAEWWPASLRIDPPEGKSQQHELLRRMIAAGGALEDEMRGASARVIERLATEMNRRTLPALEAFLAKPAA